MKRKNYLNSSSASKRGASYQRTRHVLSAVNHKLGQRVPGLHYYTSSETSAQMANNKKHDYYTSNSNISSSALSSKSNPSSGAITNDLDDPNNPNSPDNPNNPNNYQYISRKHRHHKWELIIGALTCLATITGVWVTWNNNNNKPANHTEKIYPTKQAKNNSKSNPKPQVKVKKIYEHPKVKKIVKHVAPKSAQSTAPKPSASSASQPSSVSSCPSASALRSRATNVGNTVKNKAIQFGHRLQGYEQKPSNNSSNN